MQREITRQAVIEKDNNLKKGVQRGRSQSVHLKMTARSSSVKQSLENPLQIIRSFLTDKPVPAEM